MLLKASAWQPKPIYLSIALLPAPLACAARLPWDALSCGLESSNMLILTLPRWCAALHTSGEILGTQEINGSSSEPVDFHSGWDFYAHE